ncbi:hypothetical protein [Mucilaginibacter gilvus]|uniref:Uncharacterized protein n=1 Tax=Mucilaginibacter gilvus TaxID=2305909 RepID=A0A3S3ZAJ9_9SPHI|nr:hypothetical protein [Mucilaginibacter gilvus]RWY57140.1 hypothetical protein EPL05_00990 [Mucilaginibacter gilvus]
MIQPEDDQLAQDDQLGQTENEDQISQQDIHSNGFDETNEPAGEINESAPLQRAYDAAESAYTLNLDDDPPAGDDK